MVTHILDGKSRVHLPRRPLAVSMTIVGTANSAVLQARRSGSVDPDSIAHSPLLLILPRVQYDTVLVVLPGAGLSTFPSGTIIHVSIAVDSSRETDPDRAQLTPRDVSGLTSLELATIGPDGDLLAVTTRLDEPEVPLGPLASRARAAARAVLGEDQVPDSAQLPVDIWIDTSLSMIASVRDGSIRAAVDILAGISTVIAADHPPVVRLLGTGPTELSRIGFAELGSTTQIALESVHFGVGFDVSRILPMPSDRITFLVTDSATSCFVDEGAVTLIITPSRVSRNAPTLPGAAIAPAADGSDASTYLMADPRQVDEAVASLLRFTFERAGTGATL